MSIRVTWTAASPDGLTGESVDVVWGEGDKPSPAELYMMVGGLVSPDHPLPLEDPLISPDRTDPTAMFVGADLEAGQKVEIRAAGQRVIWPASDSGTPAGNVAEKPLIKGDYVINVRGGAVGAPVWRKQ